MEELKKKGTGTEAPAPNNHFNYNRVQTLCLGLSLIAMTIFAIGYIKTNDRAVFLGLGMMLSSLIMHIALNPIEKEDIENEE